uniref:Uncharacterized protein n=1 Tax=Acrobeloides nanus TaxID=290746 RepID=A0A914DZM5_9BILA
MVDKLSDIAFDIPLLKAIRSQIEQREESSKRFQAIETRTFERPTSKLVNPAAATPPSELEQERIPEAPTTSNHDEADGLTVPDNWVSLAEPEDDVIPEPSTSNSTLSLTVTFNPTVSQKQATSQKSQRNSSSSKIGKNPKNPTRRPKTLPSKSKVVANIQIQAAHTPIKVELNLPATSSIRSDMLDKPESKKKPKTSAKKQSHAASKSSESSARQSPKHQGPVEIPNEEKILEYFGVSNRVQLMNLKQFKFLTPEQMKDVSGELLVQLRNLYGSYRVACLTYMQNAIFQLPPDTFNVSALFSIWKNVGAISKNPEVETIFENIPDTSCVICGSKKNNNQLGEKKSHVFSESHVKNHFEKYGTEPPEVITFLKFVKEENNKLSSQNIQVPQTLSIPQFPDAGPSNPSFFALPSLENIEVDSKILNHFKVSTNEELFALPQFSQPYVLDEKEFDQVLETQFVKYRDVCVHYLKNTTLSLPPENFHAWSLFKVYLGVQKNIEIRFLQYHHEGLKAIVQEAPQICPNCDDKTKNVKIGLRAVHIFSPSHIIQHLQRTSTEPPEILAYLKIVSENAKSFDKIQEFSALQAAAKQKTIVEHRLMALVFGKESTRKRKRKKKANDNKETSKRVKK